MDDGQQPSMPMYGANLRVMAHMFSGISAFAMQLAKQGRITPGEVEQLAHLITLPSADDESALLVELREVWAKWIDETMASVWLVAQAAEREKR